MRPKMTDELVEKLRQRIRDGIACEEDAVYLMVKFRKLLEREGLKKQLSALRSIHAGPGSRQREWAPAGRMLPRRDPPMRRLLIFLTIVSTVTACASSPPRAQRSEFEDIPVPKGLELDWSRSTVIESPTIKAARLFYKGRITPDSLAVAYRSTLEANGWRHVSTTTTDRGTTQVYEKAGSPLQVLIYEGWYYTWAEVSATRVVSKEPGPAR